MIEDTGFKIIKKEDIENYIDTDYVLLTLDKYNKLKDTILELVKYKDLEKLKKENIPTSKENTFIFDGKEYQGELGLFQLIYDLSQYGLFGLNHDNFEEKGVVIIL